MACEVKIIEASQSAVTGDTLYTFQLRYWRAIHAELMTHKAPSRNAGSSRAIPVKTVLAQVWNDPAGPIHWGANQAGMQARAELVGWRRAAAGALWRGAGKVMCVFAWSMMKLGLHKQVANRLLEPWQYINVVFTCSGKRLLPIFALRCHPDAQPEFQELAGKMRTEVCLYIPTMRPPGAWHLPYVSGIERRHFSGELQLKLSTARVARVSYTPFDGNASIEKEMQRHDDLVGSDPMHASPTEHQAVCCHGHGSYANLDGFKNYRTFLELKEAVPV